MANTFKDLMYFCWSREFGRTVRLAGQTQEIPPLQIVLGCHSPAALAAILLGLQVVPYLVLCCIELIKVHLASNCWNPFLARGKKGVSPSGRDCVEVLQTGLQKGEDSYPTPQVVQIFWWLRRKLKLTDLTWTWNCHSLTFSGVYCAPREDQSGK